MDNNGNQNQINDSVVSLVAVQNQLWEIKGILQTLVTEHARRLGVLDDTQSQLRNDLTVVKETAAKEIATLRESFQARWEEGQRAGNAELQRVNRELTNLENGRKENRDDIQEIRQKAAQTWPRTVSVLSALAAVGVFVLDILSKVQSR